MTKSYFCGLVELIFFTSFRHETAIHYPENENSEKLLDHHCILHNNTLQGEVRALGLIWQGSSSGDTTTETGPRKNRSIRV